MPSTTASQALAAVRKAHLHAQTVLGGLVVDGDFGKRSQARENTLRALAKKSPDAPWPPEAAGDEDGPIGAWVLDQRSADNIAQLAAEMRPHVIALLRQAHEKLGATMVVTTGYRSDAEQNRLYAQGRTAPGKKVTWVKAPNSWHQHRVAIDLTLFAGGKPVYESPLYAKVGQLGIALGFEWLGPKGDEPHFHMRNGKTIQQAIALRSRGLTVFDA